MPHWTDRVWDWLGVRRDAAPALPGPVMEQRKDGAYSPLSGFGDPGWDRSVTLRPNPYWIPLREDELRTAYRDNGLARRIVDLLPSRATRKGWTVPDIGLSEDRRLRTWERTCTAGQMARLLGGAVVLMVTEDDVPRLYRNDPRRWLEQPLDLNRVGVLHNLVVFDATQARPVEWERDLREVGYGLPRVWALSGDGISARVHASRVAHFRGARRLPSEMRGGWYSNGLPDESVLQAVWEQISALCVTMQAGTNLAQELREAVMKIADLPQKQVGDESDAFATRMSLMARFKSMFGINLIGAGDEYENRSTPPTGFKDLSEGAQQMLRTVLGWPDSMLSGEPPGGLDSNDEAGRERERQVIGAYQEDELRVPLEQLYRVLYASQDGPTAGLIPDEWEVTFGALDTPTEKETAELRKLVADTDTIYLAAGVIRAEDVTLGRFGEDGWSLDLPPVKPIDPIEQAEIQAETMRIMAEAAPPDPDADPDTEPEDDDPRADATDPDSVSILVPAADPGLRGAVASAIGQALTTEGEPHVTILFMGRGHGQRKIAEVIRIVREEAARTEAGTLMSGTLRAFPPGPDGVPIVVEFSDQWPVTSLRERLLHRLAHLVRTRQAGRGYRAHLTVGYARAPLSPEATTALLGVSAAEVRVGVSELRVQVGGQVVASISVGG